MLPVVDARFPYMHGSVSDVISEIDWFLSEYYLHLY